MLKQLTIAAVLTLGLVPGVALAEVDEGHIEDVDFSYEGPFGKYDENQLQRGLQVFTEVCSACHGMEYLTYRALGEAGGPSLPEDQVRA